MRRKASEYRFNVEQLEDRLVLCTNLGQAASSIAHQLNSLDIAPGQVISQVSAIVSPSNGGPGLGSLVSSAAQNPATIEGTVNGFLTAHPIPRITTPVVIC